MDTTFPRLLLEHAARRPLATALREKEYGIWQSLTWSALAQMVKTLACGLHQAGLKRGEHVIVVGANRPRLYASMLAAQSLGAIPVPLYQDAVATEYVFPINNAEVRFAVVENQEQVDKLLEIRTDCAGLAHIYFDDPRGLRNYQQTGLASLTDLQQQGEQFAKQHPGFFDQEVATNQADDVAAMFFTSGTTGNPKGVVHTHRSLLDRAKAGADFDHLSENEEVLAYMPPAWIGQNIFSYAQWLSCGYVVNCPESAATVNIDLKEIGPTYYFAPPRVFEGMLTTVMIRMEDASSFKRSLFAYFMDIAKRYGPARMDGQSIGLMGSLLYGLGNLLVYGPLRNTLGFSRVRVAYTAGEAIGPDLFDFYRSIGINLKQLYGMTETCVTVCMQRSGDVKLDTVGRPMSGVEVKIADGGEVLVRSPGLMVGYYKKPDDTAEAIDAEGYFHTGDAGFFDPDGHLKIIDRAKDVGKMADGTLFAPKYIENKLKFFPFIKEAVAFGDGRSSCNAFINIDMEAVGNWAERRNLAYSGYSDLASQATVYELIAECVEKVNADLAHDELLSGSQVHRFLILHKELDPDDDELTRTRKVRRRFISEKYAILIEALYDGRERQFIETQVKFEDGRQGIISADLEIRNTKTFGATRKAA